MYFLSFSWASCGKVNNAWRPEKKLAVTPKRTRRLKCYRSLVASNFVQTVSPVAFFCSRVGNKKKKKNTFPFLFFWNVTSLCLNCHLQASTKKKGATRLPVSSFFFWLKLKQEGNFDFILSLFYRSRGTYFLSFFFPSGEYFIRLSRKAVLVVFSSENPLTLIQKKKVKVLNENEEGKKQKLWKNLARKKEDD